MGFAIVVTDALTAGIAQGNEDNPTTTTRGVQNFF
jgi:hypothetical protein